MIYLDNNATTRIDEEVLDAMMPFLKEEYGNPGSKYYSLGSNAKNAVEDAREKLAKLINAEPKEIIFTSSGSESNNLLIKGMADYLRFYEERGNHLLTSSVEHKSVINSFRFLDGEIFMNKEIKKTFGKGPKKIDRGYRVDFLDVDREGLVNLEELEKAIEEDTILGSFIWANNETGSINNIKAIGKIMAEKEVFFHSDGTQAVGKIDVDVKDVLVDGLTFSSHKIYGPKGVGALYLKSREYSSQNITSLIHGGSDQESGYRAGTLPVHDIVGFGKAAEIAKRDLDKNSMKISEMEKLLIKILKDKYEDIIFLTGEEKVPGVISFLLPDKNNQLYLKKIGDRVAMSSGSACTMGTDLSIVEAMGLDRYKSNFLRIAIGKNNTMDEIEKLKEIL